MPQSILRKYSYFSKIFMKTLILINIKQWSDIEIIRAIKMIFIKTVQ